MSDIEYRTMVPAEAEAVTALILRAFERHIADGYSAEGAAEFRRFVDPEALRGRVGPEHFVLVAATPDGLAGMVEVRRNNHVSLLFVDDAYQRRGVARALLERGLAEARSRDPEVERVTVNSTRYGVPAYERLGFRQTGPERDVNGIVFIPMAMRLAGAD